MDSTRALQWVWLGENVLGLVLWLRALWWATRYWSVARRKALPLQSWLLVYLLLVALIAAWQPLGVWLGVRGLQTPVVTQYQFLVALCFIGYEALADVAGILAWRMQPQTKDDKSAPPPKVERLSAAIATSTSRVEAVEQGDGTVEVVEVERKEDK